MNVSENRTYQNLYKSFSKHLRKKLKKRDTSKHFMRAIFLLSNPEKRHQ